MKNQTLLSLLAAQAAASRFFQASTKSLKAIQAASPDIATDSFVQIRKVASKSQRSAYTKALLRGPLEDGLYKAATAAEEPLDNLLEEEYVGAVSFGNQSFQVIFDTGSSDTWLVQSGFLCVDEEGNEQTEDDCYFGPAFDGAFQYGEIPDENFNIAYGDGEFLTGVLGYEDVTVAGITVLHQEVGLVNYSYWFGDEVSSGLVGLAYPYLTSAYAGTNASNDSLSNFVEYDPVFTSMVKQNLSAPLFSLALTRNSSEGYIAFGGLPPVDYAGEFASTPILKISINEPYKSIPQYEFYTIVPDSYTWKNATTSASNIPIIVDSGTTLAYLPTNIAEPILAAYSPPAVYLENEGAYFAPCDATPPEFGITIGGTTFQIDPKDMIYTDIVDPDTGYCLAGIVDGGDEGSFILGGTFLNNVVAVFDVGAAEMRFAARVPY
ncbi:aspartic peptidase domain-containing protein [Pseudomassariella vexata]|uniref:Aspartic peptidase domain-containing protein n=1 Tax=Pseudomassariella vexata TaxID=1141098 RepID=A0A1Y2E8Z3_9PEZI|nr:aspartic peptidase domain-containing protein [Pseudomassariella vexata]ORY67756.1 aspartic peptidase domain-containing protein [Pseudomassariella vexata]